MEELDFNNLLQGFSGFDRGERIILGHFGTVQTLLSLVFNRPVSVRLVDQCEEDGFIIRHTLLTTEEDLLCWAASRIPKSANRQDVIVDIREGRLGLGRIVARHQLVTQRSLKRLGRDEWAFWREYTIEGPDVCVQINETFRRKPFEAAGWTKHLNGRMKGPTA